MECDEPIEVTPGKNEGEDCEEGVVPKLAADATHPSQRPHPQQTVHAEVRLTRSSTASRETVCQLIDEYLRAKGTCNVPTVLESSFSEDLGTMQSFLKDNIASISLTTDDTDSPTGKDQISASLNLQTAPLMIHVYRLVSGDEADPTHETIEVSSEIIRGGTRWALPSPEFDGLWDTLVYDSTVKRDLLKYSESALLFADFEVSQHVIVWNRVIFLHGPPGTGKTSLCRALAHKLSIRLSHRFTSAALIEINTVNLMSKWFSESARLVSQMFSSILEYLEDPDHLVCVLVDEVESLTAVRKSVAAACEPSDAIRVVNAVLTHLDQLKHHPNVLVMATSNVTDVLDPAFLDRADIRAYIGPPSVAAIYAIYSSCLNELIRVGLIERQKSGLLSYRVLSALQFTESQVTAASLAVWRLAQRSVGLNGRTLRKLPLLAHAFHLTSRPPDRLHAPTTTTQQAEHCKLATSFRGHNKENISPSLNTPSRASAVPLLAFIEALQMAVDCQFADSRMIAGVTDESHLSAGDKEAGSCKTTSIHVDI